MLKRLLFQLHWFLGITAGTILVVMALSGVTIAFQDEIMRALNPSLAQVVQRYQAGDEAMPVTRLVNMLSEDPSQKLQRIRIDATGHRTSLARFEGGRENWHYFDPYTGAEIKDIRGLAFFDFMLSLHRRLVAGETGQAITGACTIILLFFCLSGIYLRWPRRWTSPRTWLALEWRRSGRGFLWSLHAVIGTWVLLVYLMIILTGLWWSYEWYRQAATLLLITPTEKPAVVRAPPGDMSLGRIETTLYDRIPGLQRGYLDLRLPNRPGQLATARTQVGTGTHDRAYDALELEPASGRLISHRPYADMPPGAKAVASVYALHTGSFFGLPGRIIVMLSAACMLLFFITGWMLYLDRRAKKSSARLARLTTPSKHPPAQAPTHGPPWLIVFASQSGMAEQLAWRTANQLLAAGLPVDVRAAQDVSVSHFTSSRNALLLLSTFGDGEPPDRARSFEKRVLSNPATRLDLSYGVLALGDSSYPQFCGFARKIDALFGHFGAQRMFPSVEVDRADTQALARWQQQLSDTLGIAMSDIPLEHASTTPWTLLDRTLLNPASAGGSVWKITLRPRSAAAWRAGDILDIAPHLSKDEVLRHLERAGFTGSERVHLQGRDMSLLHAAATRDLNSKTRHSAQQAIAQEWLALHPELPRREYSIASAAGDGVVELVVRLTHRDDGSYGIGSGWLCLHAPIGTDISARVRSNPSFHLSEHSGPMILIGNGTGIAGLRGILREADAQSNHGHWLIFGERTSQHDHLLADELNAWQASGHLSRADYAFSRDQQAKLYVQHRIEQHAADLQIWIENGATLYVCGSLLGMSAEVDKALRRILGDSHVETLLSEGRYKRDVY